MRIVSGKHKGKQFSPPKGIKARPTTDFAKEALFNVLNNYTTFADVSVLDLFAGTGNISYEFVSRGVTEITAVDQSLETYKFIKSMNFELNANINVIKADVFRFLAQAKGKQYDIIFADPPYALSNIPSISVLVFKHEVLKPGGVLIVEHDKFTDLSKMDNFVECRHYGKVHFSFFRN
jgi:16S rRNA (guanine966-N2)-methyltransferase